MTQHQIVVHNRVRCKPFRIHLVLDLLYMLELAVIDQTLDQNLVGGGRRVHGGIVEELLVVL